MIEREKTLARSWTPTRLPHGWLLTGCAVVAGALTGCWSESSSEVVARNELDPAGKIERGVAADPSVEVIVEKDDQPSAAAALKNATRPKGTLKDNAAAKASFARPVAEPVVVAANEPAVALPPLQSFAFSPDAAGKLLQEQLSTLPAVVLNAPARRDEPRTQQSPLEDLAKRRWAPPPADFSGPARVAKLERSTLPHARPVLDQPPIAAELTPAVPVRPRLPLAPKSRAVGFDPESVGPLVALTPVKPDPLPTQVDSTAEFARVWMLSPLPPTRTAAAGPIRVAIPDPYEHLRGFPRENLPPDADPAARNTAPLPARVKP